MKKNQELKKRQKEAKVVLKRFKDKRKERDKILKKQYKG